MHAAANCDLVVLSQFASCRKQIFSGQAKCILDNILSRFRKVIVMQGDDSSNLQFMHFSNECSIRVTCTYSIK